MLAPGYRAIIIFVGGLLFYLLTGDMTIALSLMVLLYYLEFRKSSHRP